VSQSNGAFAILDAEGGYVQCLVSMGANYLVELSSHRFMPEMAKRFTSDTVRFIDEAGFRLPRQRANFSETLGVTTRAQADELADFVLGVAHRVFDVTTTRALKITVNLPRTFTAHVGQRRSSDSA